MSKQRNMMAAHAAILLLVGLCEPAHGQAFLPDADVDATPSLSYDATVENEGNEDTLDLEDLLDLDIEELGNVNVVVRPAEAILGSEETARSMPGSAEFLSADDIRYQHYDNIDRVLRKVPGVYSRGEDGYGIFPNISLRGVYTARSAKVSLLEDGILAAPSPYSAPAAYYFPTVGRMFAVEILKGHSQIQYGPHTSGGVINLLSTPIPDQPSVYIRTLFGSDNEMRVHAWMGDTYETTNGSWGYLLEGYFRETDGFKHIDQTPDFRLPAAGNTGFNNQEPMLKLFWEPDTYIYQRLEARTGYTDRDAHATYLGLAESDFAADPFRRYASTRFDNFSLNQNRNYLRYTLGHPIDDRLSITSTVYYNQMHRNWFKLLDVRDVDTDGDGTPNPGVNSVLSRAVAGDLGGTALDVLRGQRAGVLRARNFDRAHDAWGYDAVASLSISTDRADHDVRAGFRYHNDGVRHFQTDERFTQTTNGSIIDHAIGTPGDGGNLRQQTQSVAFFVQDAVSVGPLTVTPGIRLEQLKLEHLDFRGPPDENGVDNLGLVGGGVGMTYDVSDELSLLAGVHHGYSPPSPRAALKDGLSEEVALASEFGLRYHDPDVPVLLEMLYFYTHFGDLMVIDNIAGTGTGNTENVGEIYSGGVELAIRYDPGIDRGWCFQNPWFVSLTYTRARLLSQANTADEDSIFAGAFPGARVPYIPDWACTFGSGLHYEGIGADITGIFVGETFTSASNTTAQVNPVTGNPDARFGTTDQFFIWDVSGYLKLADNWALFGGIQNMLNRKYMVSRHPHGPRPGMPLFGYLGLEAIY